VVSILILSSLLLLTLIPDDDLDRQRFDTADARHILQMLAHHGDGDWSLHYQEGKVGLPLLQAVRDHPGAKIIERALGELAIPSAKGKGKDVATDNLHHSNPAVESPGQRPTVYSGVSHCSNNQGFPLTSYRG
jgi:hypothetical protein